MVTPFLVSIAFMLAAQATPAMVSAGTPAMVHSVPSDTPQPVVEPEKKDDRLICEYWTATWCGPCNSFAPIVQKLIDEGELIVKKDIDLSSDRANQLGINQVPTLLLWKYDEVIKRHVGVMSEAGFRAWLKEDKAKAKTEPKIEPPVPLPVKPDLPLPDVAGTDPAPSSPAKKQPAAKPPEQAPADENQFMNWGWRRFNGKMKWRSTSR